jgi:hypothetical protein
MGKVYASEYLPPIFANVAETIIWQIKWVPGYLKLGLCILVEARQRWYHLADRRVELGVIIVLPQPISMSVLRITLFIGAVV